MSKESLLMLVGASGLGIRQKRLLLNTLVKPSIHGVAQALAAIRWSEGANKDNVRLQVACVRLGLATEAQIEQWEDYFFESK